MFCDLVGSTALSEQLDPEEYREVVRDYQTTGTEVISRYEGHIAQYLGDGLLVYFGYPVAHEDDAARAVRAGLEIVAALQIRVPSPFQGEGQGEGRAIVYSQSPHPSPLPKGAREMRTPLQVRIGIHTGPVVVGEIGGGSKRELLALGETPNIAACVQSKATPNTVLISVATHRLAGGLFTCENLGPQILSGISTALVLYRVESESEARNRFEVEASIGLTPLTGRHEATDRNPATDHRQNRRGASVCGRVDEECH